MQIKTVKHFAATALLTACVGSASATEIYSDDFSGSSGDDLHGTTPDVTPGGETWVARSSYKADGSFSFEGNAAMSLAFTPVDGKVYTLDAKIENLTGNHWAQFGFGNGQPSIETDPIWSPRAWHLVRVAEQTADHHTYLNGFSDGAAWSTLAGLRYAEPLDVRIELDTTGGTGSWTATWFAKADSDPTYTEVRSAALLTAEDINSVGFSVYNASKTGKLLSFSLSDDGGGGGIPADFDGDGFVTNADIAIGISNFTGPQTDPPTFTKDGTTGDTDGDGDDDNTDLAIVISSFTGPGPAPVPEPASLALLGLGGLALAHRRRARAD